MARALGLKFNVPGSKSRFDHGVFVLSLSLIQIPSCAYWTAHRSYNSPAALIGQPSALPSNFLNSETCFCIFISLLWLAINVVFICCVCQIFSEFLDRSLSLKRAVVQYTAYFLNVFFYHNTHIGVNFVNTTLITQIHGYRSNKSV